LETVSVSERPLAVVRGGGDLGSAAAARLQRAGLRVLVTEKENPTAVRRTVAFSEAVYSGWIRVEELSARLANGADAVRRAWKSVDEIPVVVDPELVLARSLEPAIVIDALVAKRNDGVTRDLAAAIIGLGPGFEAGIDVDAVVETNRGPNLGRVFWSGTAEPNTGLPADVQGRGADRVLRAPAAGTMEVIRDIPDIVRQGEVVATIGEKRILAPFDGLIRGMLHPGTYVEANLKVGDVDPRFDVQLCYRMSDKALAIAGGALEAALVLLRRQGAIITLNASEVSR
jgi:xanthine dehydrogenase accessory factor